MVRFFNIHLTIPSIHGKFSFEFRFWAHFFAFQNTDTRLKIFPTALKKFALRADDLKSALHWRISFFLFLFLSHWPCFCFWGILHLYITQFVFRTQIFSFESKLFADFSLACIQNRWIKKRWSFVKAPILQLSVNFLFS